jgi:threonine/homoserine/homoserine lactone efflux protein
MVSLRLFATGFLMTRSLALLLLFLFPLAFSPGPGNIFFSAHGAAFGLRRSLRAILLRHPALTQWVQHLDEAYVLWLAWNMIRSGLTLNQHTAHAAGFMQGVWLLLLNPKGYAIMVLMFSQF